MTSKAMYGLKTKDRDAFLALVTAFADMFRHLMEAKGVLQMRRLYFLAIYMSAIASCLQAQEEVTNAATLRAFPGAEGWGVASKGGRFGKVIKVTNLNASGPGSLAEACATEGPRIVVFEVSGVIRGDVRIKHPYITIAGQSAPGAGITVEGVVSSYNYGVHDVIIRHLRVRPRRASGAGGDSLQLGGLGPSGTGTHDIMLDHLSLSWGNDEVIDLYHSHNVSVQWCTIEESDDQGHSKGAHNYGLISAAEGNGAVSVHHNLWTHHSRRVPCMAPYLEMAASDFCNNLIHNCRGGYTDDGHGARAKSPVNLYRNYYLRGPQTVARMYPFALATEMQYYVRDNYFEDWGYQAHPRHWQPAGRPEGVPRWIQFNNNGLEIDAPAPTPAIRLVDAQDAYDLVLNNAGCWPRDRVTKRTIEEVRSRAGAWGRNGPLEPTDAWFLEGLMPVEASQDTDGDGMPDNWERSHGLNPKDAADAVKIVGESTSDGKRHQNYSYVEFYLNELADQLLPVETAGAWNLSELQWSPAMRWVSKDGPIHSLLYTGEEYHESPTEVFAFYASPATLGEASEDAKFPGVVLIHGGGGTAFAEWVWLWAKRGYAAIAMDLSGSRPIEPRFDANGQPITNQAGRPESRSRLPNGGPPQDSSLKFDSIGGTIDDDWPFHAVANAIRAHSLLRSFPEVIANRTAVTGISWGGYTTCLVASVDKRFRAAVPVYGCGYLFEGESVQKRFIDKLAERRQDWIEAYDPSSWLARCQVPMLFVNGTNDIHYPLDSYQKSFDLVSSPKQMRIEVNMRHGHPPGWQPQEIGLFIDSQCRDAQPLPVTDVPLIEGEQVRMKFSSTVPLKSASLHYTTDSGLRSERSWHTLSAEILGNQIESPKPPSHANTWFISVTDDRGAMVTSAIQFNSP
ncbi:MAG TPA: PhoPQ-activated protein PqaA family protein [Pirellula sp.]|nr:PhoPQ-activated protein PqaA family protein [Pirellula sp.]